MDAYALVDNNLAKSQLDIGLSSNLAQLAQTYACNFNDKKYDDYVCILSVLAQVAIDSAKRCFDINISKEIDRIKKDMNISANKYPSFWLIIKKGFNKKNINNSLHCPMNYLYNINLIKFRNPNSSIPMSYFFVNHKLDIDRRKCKKVEELIIKYSLSLESYRVNNGTSYLSIEDYLLFRSDFDKLIYEIRSIYISKNYLGLMSWLIDRALAITPSIKRNSKTIKSLLWKNRSLLLKILYQVNSEAFLSCFIQKKCTLGENDA